MRRAALAGAAVAAAMALAIAAAPAAGKERNMEQATAATSVRIHVGRFSLEVPADMKYVGGERSMRRLKLREVAMPGKPEEAFAAAFGVKLAEIARLKAKRMDPAWIDGEIAAQIELAPGPDRFTAVLYHAVNARSVVDVAALRKVGPAGLWLERSACDLADRDAHLKTVGAVGRAYQHVPEGAPRPKGDVFHLAAGVVALPFEAHEAATAHWNGGPLDVEIELSTQTVKAPKGGGLIARFGEAVQRAGAAATAGGSVVRSRSRTAAGLKGEEFVMRDTEARTLHFMWEFPGEATSGARPRIQLEMNTGDDRQKEKAAAWDALVDSLRPVAAP